MEKKDMEQKKALGNVGVLDLRSATEESVAGIRRVGNVGTVLYSRENAGLLVRLNMGNLGSSIEAPADAKVLSGQVAFTRDYFKNQPTSSNLVVVGQLLVHPDVPIEDIERGLGDLIIAGQVIYPEHLAGAIQSKIRHLIGQEMTYIQCPRIALGELVLDKNYLRALDDASELVVIGHLKLPQVLPTELLEQKVQRIQVIGKITCHEENVQTILAHMDGKPGLTRVTTIPAGFELVERPLHMDADLLEALPARKLYCTNRVQVDRSVDPETLDKNLEALVVKDIAICPEALKGVISHKCNMLETQVALYEGELWLVEDERTLLSSRFEYLEGRATLIVLGELTIAPDVDPKVLGERLARVHNLGTIHCTPEQMGAIQARLGLSEGKLIDSTTETADEDMEKEEMMLGNVGYLKL